MDDFDLLRTLIIEESNLFFLTSMNEVHHTITIHHFPPTWHDKPFSELGSEELVRIYTQYKDTYLACGLDLSADSASELVAKYSGVIVADVDMDGYWDAFLIYRDTQFGRKIALLGTSGCKQCKKALIQHLIMLLNGCENYYIEASKRMEEILSISNVPVVAEQEKIYKIVGSEKKVEFVSGGYYTRRLSKVDKIITKRIYGRVS